MKIGSTDFTALSIKFISLQDIFKKSPTNIKTLAKVTVGIPQARNEAFDQDKNIASNSVHPRKLEPDGT